MPAFIHLIDVHLEDIRLSTWRSLATVLVAAADHIGDRETVAVCQSIIREGIAWKWLEDDIGSVTQEFPRRDKADETARRESHGHPRAVLGKRCSSHLAIYLITPELV